MFGTTVASMPNVVEDVDQESGGDDVLVDVPDRSPRDSRAPQMIRRLAAPIVQHDRLSEDPSRKHRRQRRQQERGVGRGKDVNHVGTGNLTHEQRHVRQLVGDRAHVFDAVRATEQGGWLRIDRHEPGIYVGIASPRREKSIGLHGLTAENPKGGRNKGNFDPMRHR